jgi:hypothetical protein
VAENSNRRELSLALTRRSFVSTATTSSRPTGSVQRLHHLAQLSGDDIDRYRGCAGLVARFNPDHAERHP